MSHITRVKTKLNDPIKIERALVYLKLPFKKDADIRTFNKVSKSEFVIVSPNGWDVGLRRDETGYFVVEGDSYAWNGIASIGFFHKPMSKAKGDARKDVFANLIAQYCAITTAIVKAHDLGQKITVHAPDEDGVVRAEVAAA